MGWQLRALAWAPAPAAHQPAGAEIKLHQDVEVVSPLLHHPVSAAPPIPLHRHHAASWPLAWLHHHHAITLLTRRHHRAQVGQPPGVVCHAAGRHPADLLRRQRFRLPANVPRLPVRPGHGCAWEKGCMAPPACSCVGRACNPHGWSAPLLVPGMGALQRFGMWPLKVHSFAYIRDPTQGMPCNPLPNCFQALAASTRSPPARRPSGQRAARRCGSGAAKPWCSRSASRAGVRASPPPCAATCMCLAVA